MRFKAPLSNGGIVTWKARVVKIVDGIVYVRHPDRARTFSPVSMPGVYKYRASEVLVEGVEVE